MRGAVVPSIFDASTIGRSPVTRDAAIERHGEQDAASA